MQQDSIDEVRERTTAKLIAAYMAQDTLIRDDSIRIHNLQQVVAIQQRDIKVQRRAVDSLTYDNATLQIENRNISNNCRQALARKDFRYQFTKWVAVGSSGILAAEVLFIMIR